MPNIVRIAMSYMRSITTENMVSPMLDPVSTVTYFARYNSPIFPGVISPRKAPFIKLMQVFVRLYIIPNAFNIRCQRSVIPKIIKGAKNVLRKINFTFEVINIEYSCFISILKKIIYANIIIPTR